MSSLSRFANPQVFRRFAPVLLAEFLRPAADALLNREITLPSFPISGNMPYGQIAKLFLQVDQNLMELYDAIHLVSRLTMNKDAALFSKSQKTFPFGSLPNCHHPMTWHFGFGCITR